jgi:valine--pyruvate aminotransferase
VINPKSHRLPDNRGCDIGAAGAPGSIPSRISWSRFGAKLTRRSGILELMDDLGQALTERPDMRMMGGGNPARIPAVEAVWRRRMAEILDDGDAFDRMVGHYDAPRGHPRFIESLVSFLNDQYGWGLTPAHVALTNGSQNAMFCLFNLLAGDQPDGSFRKILLPLCPEYIGYADQGAVEDLFVSTPPRIEEIGDHAFKYRVDFERLRLDRTVAALCLSRPTNPTGNVCTDGELDRLTALAEEHRVPLIVDNAYGAPFPSILFSDVKPRWNPHMILTLSLSKLGLPGVRTGIVIAREEITEAIAAANSIVSLANGSFGPVLVEPLLASGEIESLCRTVIRPFYEGKARRALEWLNESLGDRVPWRVHRCEGALFLWLWFPGLPVTTQELYRRLKARNLLVVPGCHFFYGLEQTFPHHHECIRLNYAQPENVVREGIAILADELTRLDG